MAIFVVHAKHWVCTQAGNCTLVLGDTTTTYAACATLQGQPQPYKLYYAYEAATQTIDVAFS